MTTPSVPNSLEQLPATIVEEVEAVAEEFLFQPKPGGMVEHHRREKARRKAAEEEARNLAEPVTERAARAIKTAQVSPETVSMQTITIPAGGTAMILPLNTQRFRAVISLISASSSIIIAKDSGAAIGGQGFTMATGATAPWPMMTIQTRAQVYAQNNGGSSIQISVFCEYYAAE